METVSNIAATATRAIWGPTETETEEKATNESHGKEPVSGKLGNVDKGEPYDAGNMGDTPLATPLPTPGPDNQKTLSHDPTSIQDASSGLVNVSGAEGVAKTDGVFNSGAQTEATSVVAKEATEGLKSTTGPVPMDLQTGAVPVIDSTETKAVEGSTAATNTTAQPGLPEKQTKSTGLTLDKGALGATTEASTEAETPTSLPKPDEKESLSTTTSSTPSTSERKKRMSIAGLKDKIKDKLHKGDKK